jgi:hypothetical protein
MRYFFRVKRGRGRHHNGCDKRVEENRNFFSSIQEKEYFHFTVWTDETTKSGGIVRGKIEARERKITMISKFHIHVFDVEFFYDDIRLQILLQLSWIHGVSGWRGDWS